MKPDSNIETDKLLQNFARRNREKSAQSVGPDVSAHENSQRERQGGTEHLDADELVAYAENALVSGTRARYTSHISECDFCRKLITDLVLSSGVALQPERQSTKHDFKQARSWPAWITIIFAPGVIRYAASAVLLIGITAIALMVFRNGREPKFSPSLSRTVDSNNDGNASGQQQQNYEETTNKREDNQTPEKPTEAGTIANPVSGPPVQSEKDASQNGPADVQKSGQEQRETKPPAPASSTTGVLSGQRAAARDEDFKGEESRENSYQLDGVDTNKARKEVERSDSAGRTAPESSSRAEANVPSSTGGANSSMSNVATTTNEKAAAKTSARRNSTPSASTQPTDSDDRERKADGAGNAEGTRSVSGRQFTRRDGVWVDVAYRSQTPINVKRGSDQYRALVADEPGLRAVASQLSGDVIVVWKGTAYRIH